MNEKLFGPDRRHFDQEADFENARAQAGRAREHDDHGILASPRSIYLQIFFCFAAIAMVFASAIIGVIDMNVAAFALISLMLAPNIIIYLHDKDEIKIFVEITTSKSGIFIQLLLWLSILILALLLRMTEYFSKNNLIEYYLFVFIAVVCHALIALRVNLSLSDGIWKRTWMEATRGGLPLWRTKSMTINVDTNPGEFYRTIASALIFPWTLMVLAVLYASSPPSIPSLKILSKHSYYLYDISKIEKA